AIGPYCLFTVATSLVRDLLASDVTDMSILHGDTNALTVLVIASVWLFGYRPSKPARLLIWMFLAAWYTYRLIDELYSSEGFLYEDIWLNHMIFVTMISCLANALKHTFLLSEPEVDEPTLKLLK
ncbi:unnamed protein product, partial [Symbiodinium necroappetens]